MFIDSASLYKESYSSAFGTGFLVWNGGTLEAHLLPSAERPTRDSVRQLSWLANLPYGDDGPSEAAGMLESYFAGEQVDFPAETTRPLDGTSGFGAALKKALLKVKYGTTITYGGLAAAAGYGGAQRAAGSWLARNPLPVIIPCHRVIRANGTIGEYSGGNGWKRRLLELEGAIR